MQKENSRTWCRNHFDMKTFPASLLEMAFRTNLRFSKSLAVFSMAAVFVMYRKTVWKIGLCPKAVYFLLCAEVLISSLVLLIASGNREIRNSSSRYHRYLWFYILSACLVSPVIAALDYLAKGQELFFVPLTAAVFCGLYLPPIASLLLPLVSYLLIPFLVTGFMGIEPVFHPVMWFLTILMSAVSILRWDFMCDLANMKTRLTATNQRLKNISERDELTGLRNRMGLRNDYDHYANMRLIVAMADIDNFKFYNDTYGHDVGDLILKDLAGSLKKQFGENGVYRFGGDEFLIIETGLDKQDFERTAVNWKKGMKPRMFGDLELCPEFTLGFVYGNTHERDDLRKMISQADEQLYQGKVSGKGRISGARFSEEPVKAEADHENAPRVLDADPLTGLPNAMYFRVKSDLQVEALRKAGKDPVLVFTSIDEFPEFRRNLGIAEGDLLLKELSEDLRTVFPSDLICRFSEDHFLVLSDRDRIKHMQTVFPEMVSKSPALSSMRVHMGLYACSRTSSGASENVDCARMACEEIAGTDVMFFWYDWNLQQKRSRNAYLLTHLTEAIEKRRIEVQLVPAVRTVSQKTVELELRSAWNDPRWGMMQEEEYLPALEEAGKSMELNRYLMAECVRFMAKRRQAGRQCVPIVRKLSGKGFLNLKLRNEFLGQIDEAGLEHELFSFGISERAFRTENRALSREVRAMRELGFRVWLDDFGAGKMVIGGLMNPEFDAVRINLGTMKQTGGDVRKQEVLMAMLSLSRAMNMTSVVSGTGGAEDETQLALMGCQKLQKNAAEAAFPLEHLDECLQKGFLPPLEEKSLRHYYDKIGSIPLMGFPDQIAPSPAAIFEENDGYCRCLRWNQEFLDLLGVFDISSIRELDQKLDLEPYHSLAEAQMKAAKIDQRWQAIRFREQVSMNGACRFAACSDTDHRIAVLAVFFGPLQNRIGIPEL